MSRKYPGLSAPPYLAGALVAKFDELAPICWQMGTVTALDVDTLAKYVIAENEYLRITNKVNSSLNAGDSTSAERWISAQVRIQRECLSLAGELGLTVAARKARGLAYPGG